MLTTRNIFLIGPMGSGKTAVGRRLAKLLGRHFYDSDAEIERRTGVDVPYIFEREGESGFRDREQEVIDMLTPLDSVVLATGGGAVLRERNREVLHRRGCVIYLRTSVEQQLERTRRGRQRPLLHTEDPGARLRQLMQERAALYESLADVTVDTDRRRVGAVVEEILKALRAREPE